nr:hypothetical protein [Mycobacterium sp. UM_NZ2]
MSLKRYDVIVDGHPTTLQLSDEDARGYGLHVPAHRAPEPKAEPVVHEPETKAADAPANKARTAANKGGNAR